MAGVPRDRPIFQPTLSGEAIENDFRREVTPGSKPGLSGRDFSREIVTPPYSVTNTPIFQDIDFLLDRQASEFAYYNAKPLPIDDLGLVEFRYVITQANTEGGIYTLEWWDSGTTAYISFSTLGAFSFTTGGGGGGRKTYISAWLTLPLAGLSAEPVLRVNAEEVSGGAFFDTSNTGVTVQFRNGYAWTSNSTPASSGGSGTVSEGSGL